MKLDEILKRIRPCDLEQPYVFLSYSSRDQDTVWRDALEFQRRGYNIWLDEKNLDKTKPSWKEDAIRAVEDFCCALVVFYVSEHSLASEPCFNEMCATEGEEAVSMHFGKVPVVAVEIEPIGDIKDYGVKVHAKLRSAALSKAEKALRIKTVSNFIFRFFPTNEKVRVRAKNDPARIRDYYEDIMDSFPEAALILPPETDAIETVVLDLPAPEAAPPDPTVRETAPETPPVTPQEPPQETPAEEPAPETTPPEPEPEPAEADAPKKKEAPEDPYAGLTPEETAKLGDDHYYGRNGKPQDYAIAVACYRSAAARGNVEAHNGLGLCYYHGHGVDRDYALAVKNYFLPVAAGIADAQFNLGECFYFGNGAKQNYKTAVKYYTLAAAQGHIPAQGRLGCCYFNGLGVKEKNFDEAVKYLVPAADAGIADAQAFLGRCYYDGTGVEQDYPTALKYFRLSAAQDNAYAQNYLGDCFFHGNGVAGNPKMAVKYYRLAAKQNNAEAQYHLGVCYADGAGTDKNETAAANCYRMAADQGNADAQYALGLCLVSGTGTEADAEEAEKYFRMAADQGHKAAKEELEKRKASQ